MLRMSTSRLVSLFVRHYYTEFSKRKHLGLSPGLCKLISDCPKIKANKLLREEEITKHKVCYTNSQSILCFTRRTKTADQKATQKPAPVCHMLANKKQNRN